MDYRIVHQANLSSFHSEDHTEVVCIHEEVSSAWNAHSLYCWISDDGSLVISQTTPEGARTLLLGREDIEGVLSSYRNYMQRVEGTDPNTPFAESLGHDDLDDHPF